MTGSEDEGSILEGAMSRKTDFSTQNIEFQQKSGSNSSTENLRPLSDSSDASAKGCGTLGRRKPYEQLDKSRPLTRYLPIASSELDLRHHIESAGIGRHCILW